jgi:RNA polymerase sigma-70 factor (ECF subfamily)
VTWHSAEPGPGPDPEAGDALVDAARRGDRAALDTLLGRHLDQIHALCRRVVVHPEDALDATQEALLAIARGLPGFDGRARFTTWMYRVATNAALDELRRTRRRPEPTDAAAERAGEGDAYGAVDARLSVDAALAALPEEFRVAVVLRDLADLDYAEIADVLDLPPGTVRSRIARGRAILRRALGEPDVDPERPNERS